MNTKEAEKFILDNADKIKHRFWTKVEIKEPSECWLWGAGKDPAGYGRFGVLDWPILAHRVAWLITKGKIPEGIIVCHRCDTPACCNPAHFFLGTHKTNAEDKVAKGRQTKGITHHSQTKPECVVKGEGIKNSILVAGDIPQIRELRKAGHTYRQIGLLFSVSVESIRDVVKGYTWKHIP